MRKLRKWGATRSQRKLDRRIEKIQNKSVDLGLKPHKYLNARSQELREEFNEDALLELIKKYEAEVTLAIKGALLERKLLSYLAAEILAGRLDIKNQEKYALVIDKFYHREGRLRNTIARVKRMVKEVLAYYRR